MKCIQITKPEHFEVIDLVTPVPGEEQILVKVLAVTTCPQWDLHIYYGKPMFINSSISYPYTEGQPGHEMTGVVVSIGSKVTQFKVGDRVSAWNDQGHQRQGCYAQYVIFEEKNLIKVPETPKAEHTAPLELGMCVAVSILALREMDALRGKRIGINGLGSAGLVAAQMALAEGAAEIIGFDVENRRINYAKSVIELKRAINTESEEGRNIPVRGSGRNKTILDTSIDCVGSKESVQYIMDHTQDTVALFGVQREDYVYSPVHRGLKLIGYPGRLKRKEAASYALQKVINGSLNLGILTTHKMRLEEYGKAVEMLASKQALKVCFVPNLE